MKKYKKLLNKLTVEVEKKNKHQNKIDGLLNKMKAMEK